MFDFEDLTSPIIAAPMAGGISTPDLVAAAARAGGLGFLAGGYQPVSALLTQVQETRIQVDLFGVNLFFPENRYFDVAPILAYREALRPLAIEYGIELPEPVHTEDGWTEKIEALLDEPVPFVSFTFGCPQSGVVRALQAAGSRVIATVTTIGDALYAESMGVDALVVQGPDAGGHRATFRCDEVPSVTPLTELLQAVKAACPLPIIATGGLSSGLAVSRALNSVRLVQVGTALLDAAEAGTPTIYRHALRSPDFTETVVTRAFTGRPARGLSNEFTQSFGDLAPASYPAVNQVTLPLRRAAGAVGHAQRLSLWAGTGWKQIRTAPTAEILDQLLGSI